jgi:hypothetical protein
VTGPRVSCELQLTLKQGLPDREIIHVVSNLFARKGNWKLSLDGAVLGEGTKHFQSPNSGRFQLSVDAPIRYRLLFKQRGVDLFKNVKFPLDAAAKDVREFFRRGVQFSQNGRPIFTRDDEKLNTIPIADNSIEYTDPTPPKADGGRRAPSVQPSPPGRLAVTLRIYDNSKPSIQYARESPNVQEL